MQTVQATLVSLSKDGRRAMVIVTGEADGKKFTATRHVARMSKNGPFIGSNPDPRTETARKQAASNVQFYTERIRYLTEISLELAADTNPNDKDENEKAKKRLEKELVEAKVMLKMAEERAEKVEANYPLQVLFDA